jgi:hypothetical protein
MALIRVPFPKEYERRQALFERAAAALGRHGSYEGTPDRGTFQGHTPIGGFAGSYRFLDQSGEMEIELSRKPWIVPTHLVEHEIRKFLAQA